MRTRVQFLNTVIGKMSGVVSEAAEIEARHLATFTPEDRRAFLVEDFNRILISRIHFEEGEGEPPFQRGLKVFTEKDDLLPFEEAKLYGHNATHALGAYVCAMCGLRLIAELSNRTDLLRLLRAAFLEESGEALIRRHRGVDALFTPEGYRAYADDLLERMINPHLGDSVERVGRDPARKLGWDDRLVGTMRVAMKQGLTPRRYAFGAAAALATMQPAFLNGGMQAAELLRPIWNVTAPDSREERAVLDLIEEARRTLTNWRNAGFLDLEKCFSGV